jgi:hypothetical protein
LTIGVPGQYRPRQGHRRRERLRQSRGGVQNEAIGEINYGGSTEEIRRYALFSAMGNGNAAKFKGFAEACMAEYDLNGWTAPDLINPNDLSMHRKTKTTQQNRKKKRTRPA